MYVHRDHVDGGARNMFDIYSMFWAAVGRGSLRGSLSWVTFGAYVGHFIGEYYVKTVFFSYVSGPQSIPKIEFSEKNITLFQQVAPAARGLAWGGWGRSPVVENCVEQFPKDTFFLDLFASS